MISYSGNYVGILDTSVNESTLVLVLSSVGYCFCRHSATTNSFWKGAASQKEYGKPTDNCEQFVNALVADEPHCSPSLPLQQVKKLIGGCCMESSRSWQGRGGCVRLSVLCCK